MPSLAGLILVALLPLACTGAMAAFNLASRHESAEEASRWALAMSVLLPPVSGIAWLCFAPARKGTLLALAEAAALTTIAWAVNGAALYGAVKWLQVWPI